MNDLAISKKYAQELDEDLKAYCFKAIGARWWNMFFMKKKFMPLYLSLRNLPAEDVRQVLNGLISVDDAILRHETRQREEKVREAKRRKSRRNRQRKAAMKVVKSKRKK